MKPGLIYFIHGKERGLGGTKMTALASVAQARGWRTEQLDYSHTIDPAERLAQLLHACCAVSGPLLLVKHGGMAMEAFLEAISPPTTRARKAAIERELLDYCALDTLAMVKMWTYSSGRTC